MRKMLACNPSRLVTRLPKGSSLEDTRIDQLERGIEEGSEEIRRGLEESADGARELAE